MSSPEPARHALYSVLEDVIGPEHAETLMTHLPNQQSDEVATKGGLSKFRTSVDERFAQVDARFDRLEARFDRLEVRLDQMQRFYVGTTIGAMTALTAIFSLVAALFG